jgi:hypothetical protein
VPAADYLLGLVAVSGNPGELTRGGSALPVWCRTWSWLPLAGVSAGLLAGVEPVQVPVATTISACRDGFGPTNPVRRFRFEGWVGRDDYLF